jgi:hypothetical protein
MPTTKRITTEHRASWIKRQVGIALVWLGVPRQESACVGVKILSITHVKQSGGGIHKTTEVSEGEIACTGDFERVTLAKHPLGQGV